MKPKFKGYMKLFLHDNDLSNLINRAEFTEDWSASKRRRILKKERLFKVSLHIFDKDGFKCGHEVIEFMSKGGERELSHAIFKTASDFVNELKNKFDVDTTKSYVVVRA